MPRYKVWAQWAIGGFIEIEASDRDEAVYVAHDLDLEDFEGEYIDDSFEIPDCVEVLDPVKKRRKDIEDDPSISPNTKRVSR